MIPKQVFVIAPKVFIKIQRIFYVNLVILLAKIVKDLDYRTAFHAMKISILEFGMLIQINVFAK